MMLLVSLLTESSHMLLKIFFFVSEILSLLPEFSPRAFILVFASGRLLLSQNLAICFGILMPCLKKPACHFSFTTSLSLQLLYLQCLRNGSLMHLGLFSIFPECFLRPQYFPHSPESLALLLKSIVCLGNLPSVPVESFLCFRESLICIGNRVCVCASGIIPWGSWNLDLCIRNSCLCFCLLSPLIQKDEVKE